MILTLQTNTFGFYGGIPTYNRLVCRALNDFDWTGENSVLIAMDDPKSVALERASYPHLNISAFGGRRTAFVATALQLAARKQIDLVLSGHVNYLPLCMLLKRLQPKLRFGVFVYGREVWEPLPLIRRWSLQQADFIMSISDYTMKLAVQMNRLEEHRFFLLPNALDWSSASSEAQTSNPQASTIPQGIRLLSVGRLDGTEQRKGFDTVIESLPAIAAKVPSIQYVIVGNGTDLERHKLLAINLGVSERVHFLGSVDEPLLRDCYKSCDVFVMPSAQEGFGFVYLEAMEYGKPVVAAKSGGAPEVVTEGLTGCLIEYGNKQQLGDAIIDLCLSPEKRQRLGQAGYQSLLDKFTFDHFKQGLTEILGKELPPTPVHRFADAEGSASRAS